MTCEFSERELHILFQALLAFKNDDWTDSFAHELEELHYKFYALGARDE